LIRLGKDITRLNGFIILRLSKPPLSYLQTEQHRSSIPLLWLLVLVLDLHLLLSKLCECLLKLLPLTIEALISLLSVLLFLLHVVAFEILKVLQHALDLGHTATMGRFWVVINSDSFCHHRDFFFSASDNDVSYLILLQLDRRLIVEVESDILLFSRKR